MNRWKREFDCIEWMELGFECVARTCRKRGFDCVAQADGKGGSSTSSERNVEFECVEQVEKGGLSVFHEQTEKGWRGQVPEP